MIENKATLCLSVSALRREIVCVHILYTCVCVYVCVRTQYKFESRWWLQARFPSFTHFKSHPLPTPVSQGRWLLYKMQSPSLALAGDEIICRKLHCKHEKVMVKTMVHFSQSADSGGLGDLESVSNVEVDIKSSRLVQPESFNPTESCAGSFCRASHTCKSARGVSFVRRLSLSWNVLTSYMFTNLISIPVTKMCAYIINHCFCTEKLTSICA